MRVSGIALIAGMVVAAGFSSGARAQTPADPLVGTWHLNVAKSKYSGPAPKSAALTFESTAKGIKASNDVVLADGQTRHTEVVAAYDGKDYPLIGSPIADTVSVTRDGDKRIRTDKKGGKVVMTYTGTVSADGKTFTVVQKGTGEKGEPVDNVLVFEKH